MNKKELKNYLKKQGYYNLRQIPGKGLCGLYEFIFTIGLCTNLDEYGYEGRYCYPKHLIKDSIVAIELWNGKEDPIGDWIKYKGNGGERSNPKLKN